MRASLVILGSVAAVSATYNGTTPSSTSSSYGSTPSCAAPGTTDSQGNYYCNPARTYPAGQTCVLVNGCYILKYPATSSSYYASSTSTSKSYSAIPTPSCPAAGSTDSKGRYSCNPAHSYPSGQTCDLVDGCYYLCSTPGKPVTTSVPVSYPASSATKTTSASYSAQPTPSCPAAGTTDSKGYSCNPAHSYPNGQTCVAIDGCYYLQYPSSSTSATITPTTVTRFPPATTSPAKPTGTQYYTGAGNKAASFGGLAAVFGLAAFAL